MFESALAPGMLLLMQRLGRTQALASRFYLAGGTALALRLGHRRSRDLDLFSREKFDSETVAQALLGLGGRVLAEQPETIHALAGQTKISCFHYPYPLVEEAEQFAGLRLAGLGDIACMKLVAVAQRSDKKDFFDLAEILGSLEPRRMRELLDLKYGAGRINAYHLLKSLVFFEDAETSPEPESLNGRTWEQVKRYLVEREPELTAAFLRP